MDPISVVLGLVSTVVSRIWPDKTEEEKAQLAAALQIELDQTTLAKAQIDVNAVEAASGSLFTAGWRPAIGWVCALAFGWAYLIQPALTFILTIVGVHIAVFQLDLGSMMPVLMGMLGLGGLRTYEKLNDLHNKH